ncbi:MAG: sigma-70 family RNA polymerase sigma factor [Phycisphaerae bacterium]|nr:sigma-70 family RNA polymerase sigma factor [Phycisphaerae bacterium]
MSADAHNSATELSGEAERILPAVYEELRRLARARLSQEPAGLTLQPTGLVHEAYLRLAKENQQWQNKAHFFAAAAVAMRRILIERARRKRVVRDARSLTDLESGGDPENVDLLALDPALDKLCRFDRRLADVVQLRFFAGLSVEQTAEVMGIAERTVKRDWNFARAWLKQKMESDTGH